MPTHQARGHMSMSVTVFLDPDIDVKRHSLRYSPLYLYAFPEKKKKGTSTSQTLSSKNKNKKPPDVPFGRIFLLVPLAF